MENRFESPVLWLALFALVGFVTKEWLGFEIPKLDTFAELFLGCLIAFGVVNNPTTKNHF